MIMTLLNSHSDLAFSTIASAPLMLLMRLKIKFNCHLVLIRWENWRTGENLQRKRFNKLNPYFVGGYIILGKGGSCIIAVSPFFHHPVY